MKRLKVTISNDPVDLTAVEVRDADAFGETGADEIFHRFVRINIIKICLNELAIVIQWSK